MTARYAVFIFAFAAAGCASAGATYRSGVADRFMAHAPWYAGVRTPADSGLLVLPVAYQRGGSQSAMFDPATGAGTPVAGLIAEMNDFLGEILADRHLATISGGTPPDVHFGCEVDVSGECTNGPAAPFEWGRPRMRLAVGRPSEAWVAAVARQLEVAGAAHALVITLEVGQYWPQQTNWRGSKAVELGSDHTASLPWLTSLETPVSVLQLTGAVMGRDGRALRIGAEGLLARRTGIIAAGLGAQALITDDDVQNVRAARRHDLPGNPLVWKTALRTLVTQLTGAALID